MSKKSLINLLPQEEFEASVLGRVLRWAVSTFRVIVIITEVVVLGAFLSRFWLDAKNSDITESIRIKVAQVEAQKDTEDRFRDIQQKLSIFKSLSSEKKPTVTINSVASKIPPEIQLTSISIQEESTTVKGVSGSEFGITQFIGNLRADESFRQVNLGTISSAEDNPGLTLFTLNILY